MAEREASGRRLQEVREHCGVSQLLLAQLIGVSKGTIQNYEAGRVRMHVDRIEQLAHALSVDVADLIAAWGSPLPKMRNRGARPRLLRGLLNNTELQAEFGLWLGPIGFYSRGASIESPVDIDRVSLRALGLQDHHGGRIDWGEWMKRVHPDNRAQVQREIERLGQDGVFAAHYLLAGADGVQRSVIDCSRMACDAMGRPSRLNGTIIDASHLRRTQSTERAIARWLRSFRKT